MGTQIEAWFGVGRMMILSNSFWRGRRRPLFPAFIYLFSEWEVITFRICVPQCKHLRKQAKGIECKLEYFLGCVSLFQEHSVFNINHVLNISNTLSRSIRTCVCICVYIYNIYIYIRIYMHIYVCVWLYFYIYVHIKCISIFGDNESLIKVKETLFSQKVIVVCCHFKVLL